MSDRATRGAGERRGFALAIRLVGRVPYIAAVALAAIALWITLAAVVPAAVEAQAEEDWDGVTEDIYDSSATDRANRDITEAQEQRDEAKEGEESLDCVLCAEAREYQEQSEAATDATYEGTAELIDARAQAIVDAPADNEEQVDDKYGALDTLEDYADEWSPDGENEGEADPQDVEDARAEVDEQAAEVEGSDSSGDSGGSSGGGSSEGAAEEDTAEETTSAPPAGGSDGGGSSGGSGGSSGGDDGSGDDNSGGSDEGGDEGPLAGLSDALSGFGLGTLLAAALILIGILYYVGGLLKEGLGARARRVGRPTQAHAAPSRKPSSKGSSGGKKKPEPQSNPTPKESPEEPREERPKETKNERPGGKSEGQKKSSDEGSGDSSALADRLGAGGRNRRREEGEDLSSEDLNDLFSEAEDDEEGGDEGHR